MPNIVSLVGMEKWHLYPLKSGLPEEEISKYSPSIFLNVHCTFEMIPPMIISTWSYHLKVIHYDERCMCTKIHITLSWWYLKRKKDKERRFGQSTADSLELGDCV